MDKANEPGHSNSYNFTCVPSEDSDQPSHPSSLIMRAGRMKMFELLAIQRAHSEE